MNSPREWYAELGDSERDDFNFRVKVGGPAFLILSSVLSVATGAVLDSLFLSSILLGLFLWHDESVAKLVLATIGVIVYKVLS